MHIAIIGGGAAGMVTAYLLAGAHRVTLFESQPMLGGNIRTLGKNVACAKLEPGLTLDAGVIEFSRQNFPLFHKLMTELDVPLMDVPGTTSFINDSGPRLESPGNIRRSSYTIPQKLGAYLRLIPMGPARSRFFKRTNNIDATELYDAPLNHYLDNSHFSQWCRLLALYAYSIPHKHIGSLPAALAVPTLRAFMQSNDWTAIKGGVYTYIEHILARADIKVHTNAQINAIQRSARAISINLSDSQNLNFDAVVIATPPDQVLGLLAAPTDDENRRFKAWTANHATTLVHSDTELYKRRAITYYSEFDVFKTKAGENGYNAYLNRLCGIPTSHNVDYSLSYGLDSEIDPAKVLHKQAHHTPMYTVEALRHRRQVRATNGQNATYYAGAWLYDGLHEGAIISANEVSKLLGGQQL